MEKSSLARQGWLSLPPGFRFHPTDEELVLQYLRKKVLSCPLPAQIIPEIDLGKHDPWDLPGVSEKERYFFSLREAKYRNGNRSNRATSSGYWKATGRDRPISASQSHQVVGMKKVLVFYQGKPPAGSRTNWIMHEYRLAGPEPTAATKNSTTLKCAAPAKDWVLCRIFMKKRGTLAEGEARECSDEIHGSGNVPAGFINFFRQQRSRPLSPSASSESSCVTSENSSDGFSSGEENSSSSSIDSPP